MAVIDDKITNGDRIRHMTDEELAEFIDIYDVEDICKTRCAKIGEERGRCTCCGEECKSHILKWLKQEVSEMPEVRLIDANALKNDIDSSYVVFGQRVYAKGIVDRQPTIEPEVQHGEWHECWYTDTVCASICTNCGKAATQERDIVGQELMTNVRYPLCPNCGAKMDGGDS